MANCFVENIDNCLDNGANIVKVYIKDGHLIIKLKDIKITPNINKIKKFEGKTFFNDYKDIILTNKIPVI